MRCPTPGQRCTEEPAGVRRQQKETKGMHIGNEVRLSFSRLPWPSIYIKNLMESDRIYKKNLTTQISELNKVVAYKFI